MVRIFLTEKGLEKKEVSRKTVLHFNYKMQEAIPQEELDTFFRVTGRIISMIENKEIF
jgi:MarR family transcriptional regulator, organic hydroperoxide resistance regulator